MAGQVKLQSRGLEVKPRRPWVVAMLSVLTLGIYSMFWYYKVNREMRDFGSSHGDQWLAESKPWQSLIAVTIGGLIVIPELVSLVRTVRRVQAVERIAAGAARPVSGLTLILVGSVVLGLGASFHRIGGWLLLAGAVAFVTAITLIQARLNAAWQASVSSTPGSRDATVALTG